MRTAFAPAPARPLDLSHPHAGPFRELASRLLWPVGMLGFDTRPKGAAGVGTAPPGALLATPPGKTAGAAGLSYDAGVQMFAPDGQQPIRDDMHAHFDAKLAALKRAREFGEAHGVSLSDEPAELIYTEANLAALAQLLELLPPRGTKGDPLEEPEALAALDLVAGLDPAFAGKLVEHVNLVPLLAKPSEAVVARLATLMAATSDTEQRAYVVRAILRAEIDAQNPRFKAGPNRSTVHMIRRGDGRREVDLQLKAIGQRWAKERKAAHGQAALDEIDARYNAELDAFVADKRAEMALEDAHGLSLDTSEMPFEDSVIEAVETATQVLPEAHFAGNEKLHRVARNAENTEGDGHVLAHHDNGTIRVFDGAIEGDGVRVGGGEASALSGIEGRVTRELEVLVHEVGHNIHDQHPDALDAFAAAAGWQAMSAADARAFLIGEGLSDAAADAKLAELAASKDAGGAEYATDTHVLIGNKYVGPGDGVKMASDPDITAWSFLLRERELMPGDVPHSHDERVTHGRYNYAYSNPLEHFAEVYMHFVISPELAHKDLIEAPQATVERKRMFVQMWRDQVERTEAISGPGKRLEGFRAQLAHAEDQLETAEQQAAAMAEQWRIMREDVMGAGAAEAAARGRVQAALAGLPEAAKPSADAIVATFEETVVKCGTPYQVQLVTDGTVTQLEALR